MLNIPIDQLDSDEEKYFVMWLEELRKKDLCMYRYQPRTFKLFDGSFHRIKYKNGKGIVPRDVEYTPDFSITWDEKLLDILFAVEGLSKKKSYFHAVWKHGFYVSVIDIKGGFAGRNNTSAITFPLKQKWMLQVHNLYVQKIIPVNKNKGLFADTFTPAEYLFTSTGKSRKIHYKPKMINKFLEDYGIQ